MRMEGWRRRLKEGHCLILVLILVAILGVATRVASGGSDTGTSPGTSVCEADPFAKGCPCAKNPPADDCICSKNPMAGVCAGAPRRTECPLVPAACAKNPKACVVDPACEKDASKCIVHPGLCENPIEDCLTVPLPCETDTDCYKGLKNICTEKPKFCTAVPRRCLAPEPVVPVTELPPPPSSLPDCHRDPEACIAFCRQTENAAFCDCKTNPETCISRYYPVFMPLGGDGTRDGRGTLDDPPGECEWDINFPTSITDPTCVHWDGNVDTRERYIRPGDIIFDINAGSGSNSLLNALPQALGDRYEHTSLCLETDVDGSCTEEVENTSDPWIESDNPWDLIPKLHIVVGDAIRFKANVLRNVGHVYRRSPYSSNPKAYPADYGRSTRKYLVMRPGDWSPQNPLDPNNSGARFSAWAKGAYRQGRNQIPYDIQGYDYPVYKSQCSQFIYDSLYEATLGYNGTAVPGLVDTTVYPGLSLGQNEVTHLTAALWSFYFQIEPRIFQSLPTWLPNGRAYTSGHLAMQIIKCLSTPVIWMTDQDNPDFDRANIYPPPRTDVFGPNRYMNGHGWVNRWLNADCADAVPDYRNPAWWGHRIGVPFDCNPFNQDHPYNGNLHDPTFCDWIGGEPPWSSEPSGTTYPFGYGPVTPGNLIRYLRRSGWRPVLPPDRPAPDCGVIRRDIQGSGSNPDEVFLAINVRGGQADHVVNWPLCDLATRTCQQICSEEYGLGCSGVFRQTSPAFGLYEGWSEMTGFIPDQQPAEAEIRRIDGDHFSTQSYAIRCGSCGLVGANCEDGRDCCSGYVCDAGMCAPPDYNRACGWKIEPAAADNWASPELRLAWLTTDYRGGTGQGENQSVTGCGYNTPGMLCQQLGLGRCRGVYRTAFGRGWTVLAPFDNECPGAGGWQLPCGCSAGGNCIGDHSFCSMPITDGRYNLGGQYAVLCGDGFFCGDGIATSPETCDDGNTISGDGCTARCQAETCTGTFVGGPGEDDCAQFETPVACSRVAAPHGCQNVYCGGGGGGGGDNEQPIDKVGGSDSTGGSSSSLDDSGGGGGGGGGGGIYWCGCSGTMTCATLPVRHGVCDSYELYGCRHVIPGPGPSAVCGNGIVEDGEYCDDSNHVAGDGCDRACRFEDQYCRGQAETALACSALTSQLACSGARTVNGQTGAHGSECQWTGSPATCTGPVHVNVMECVGQPMTVCGQIAGCEWYLVPYCGNGRVEAGEDCDDGNNDDRDSCTNHCRHRTAEG